MKTILSLLKILFLALLLAANVIGFHYYFTPVAKDNLAYVPANGKLIFTVNLKSISGKLFEEAIFNPDVFEKELITKDERSLVLKNSSYGVNPFGLATFFVFPYNNKSVSGVSLNLQNSAEFIREMEKSDAKSQTVDGVLVFQGEKNTFFVYEKAVVILLETFSKSENETLAVEVLQNDELSEKWIPEYDFQMITQSGMLKNTFVESYFRMIPSFVESLTLNGNFESGRIQLNGKLSINENAKLKDTKGFLTERNSLSTENAMSIGLSGTEFSPVFNQYLNSILRVDFDSTGRLKEILKTDFNSLNYELNGISLEMDLFSIGADLLTGKWFDPAYNAKLKLANTRKVDTFSVERFIKGSELSSTKRKVLMSLAKKGNSNKLQGHFYFHPLRFIENSDLHYAIRSMIDSFIIFEEIYFILENIQDNEANFKGEVVFIDSEVHTLIQLRLLFKNLTSLI